MNLTRIVPVLLLKHGQLVRSSRFSDHRYVGDPFMQCERFNSWDIDELFYINIGGTPSRDPFSRHDTRTREVTEVSEIQRFVARVCQVPLAWGGGLRTDSDANQAIETYGADKVVFTTALFDNPKAITNVARRFGSQAVCVGIDFRASKDSISIFIESGSKKVSESLTDTIQTAQSLGAGEILLHAIDRDGLKNGYNLEVLKSALEVAEVPIVILGGAGSVAHMVEAAKLGVSGVGASNLWHFVENLSHQIRSTFEEQGIEVRCP